MKCLEKSATGVQLFRFEHGPSYQKAQIEFWKAVEKMNPEPFVVRLYKILQDENICNIQCILTRKFCAITLVISTRFCK